MDAQTKYNAAVAQRAGLEQQAAETAAAVAAAVDRLAPVDELAALQSRASALEQLIDRAKTLERQAEAALVDEQIDDLRTQMNGVTAIIGDETRFHGEAHQAARAAMRAADERLAAVQNARSELFGQISTLTQRLDLLRG